VCRRPLSQSSQLCPGPDCCSKLNSRSTRKHDLGALRSGGWHASCYASSNCLSTSTHNDVDSSHFTLFDLEPRFAISMEELDTAFRALAARVHPDKFVRAEATERQRSMILATQANEAYWTLRKPLLRARHLLSLRGVPTGDQGSTLPREFLGEHMELREALADAKQARNLSTLRLLEEAIRSRSTMLHERLAIQLDQERNDAAAAETVQQLMFIEKVAGEVADARAALED
jgi:molecular chaperone HscB